MDCGLWIQQKQVTEEVGRGRTWDLCMNSNKKSSVPWAFHRRSLQKIKQANDWGNVTVIANLNFLTSFVRSLFFKYCLLWHVHSRILCVMLVVYRMHLPRNKHIPKASGHWATLLFHVTYCRSAHRMTCFTVCHLIALLLGFSKVRWAWLKFIRKQCCTKLLFLIFSLPENLLFFWGLQEYFWYYVKSRELFSIPIVVINEM